jgi:glycosyltransferase involved in cell wall biosynthesis
MKILLFANTDWYLYNFRLPLARAIREQGHEVVLLSPPGKFSSRLEQAGFRWIEFPLERRRLNPLAEVITILRLIRLYKLERPDLVHHFTLKCVLYGSIAARVAGIKSVVNAFAGLGHIFSDGGFQAKMLRSIVSPISKLALRRTQVIFQNPDDHRIFLEHQLVSEDESHLIRGSGVDVETFNPSIRRPCNGDRRVLLASRLLWAKGVAEYVEAARIVRESMPGAQFLIAGETDPGNPAAVSHDVIEKWKAQGDLEILGHCEDMRELLRKVDVVALPSFYGEGVPRILIEAAATGLPLVATDTPGCCEVVRHGINGFLVQPKDAGQLARAIKKLLLDDELRAEMGKRSRELACTEFSEDQVINRTLQVYQECVLKGQVNRPKTRGWRGSFDVSHSASVRRSTKQEERAIW